MSHFFEFSAASGTFVDGANIAAAPASTNYDGNLVTSEAGSLTNAAFNNFLHTADNTQPFIFSGVFRKSSTAAYLQIGNVSYGHDIRIIWSSSTLGRAKLGTMWRGDVIWGDAGVELPFADGDFVPFVIRGVWSSATTYAIDFFIGSNKYSGTLNTDPAHTPDRIAWSNNVMKMRFENITLDDTACTALLASQLAVNAAPSFPGPNIGNQTGSVGTSYSLNIASKFNDSDALTFSAVGTWPAGITVSGAGLISGTPTTAGTYSTLKVRATDTAAQTVDSDTFSFTISAVGNASASGGTGTGTGTGSGGAATGGATGTGSFTSDVLVNNTGTVLASTTVYWSWWQGAIGATPTSLTHGSSVTNASGIFTAASLPTGAGFMLARDSSGATVYYQPGTI